MKIMQELRRRRVFRTAGVYIVGAWLIMQIADVFFPAWGLPDEAIHVLLIAAILCFPLALVFGWFFDITSTGIVRTPRAGPDAAKSVLTLQRRDYLILASLALVAILIVVDTVREIATAPSSRQSDYDVSTALQVEAPANSVAVLPFANISDDPGNEAFCDGISEEILHKLGEFRDLHVIARTSSFAFKDSDYQIPHIAAILGVRYLLQGSVRRSGSQLRISAQLVDRTGAQRWSDRFDREIADIFDLQTEIADIVATTVVPRISTRHDAKYQPDVDAYQQFLVGRDLLHRRQVESARVELARAIKFDPDFAEAHAEYAIAMAMWNSSDEMRETARHSIDEALRLRPGLPRALAARGLMLYDSDLGAAEAILREALAAEPTMADAINWLANTLKGLGKFDEAMELRERGMRIDPLHPANAGNLAGDYHEVGALEKAESILLRYNQQPNPSLMIVVDTAHFYRRIGRLPDALRFIYRAAELPDAVRDYPTWSHMLLADAWALLGDFDTAAKVAARGREIEPVRGSLDWVGWIRLHVAPAIWVGDFAGAIDRFNALPGARDALARNSILGCNYGYLAALAGEYSEAINLIHGTDKTSDGCDFHNYDANLALVWSYLHSGETGKAESTLQKTSQLFMERDRIGHLKRSNDLYHYALTALLLDDNEAALERLQRAIDAGWREYYLHRYDPRWSALHDEPQYIEMMEWVKADVDRQAAALRLELPPSVKRAQTSWAKE